MNKDKIIKDLKERNNKLADQYRLRDIRCTCLERENKQLKEDKKKNQPLIDLKNKYLAELRSKNMIIGILKKKVGENEKNINSSIYDNFNN